MGIGFGIVALVVSGGAAAQGKEAKPARRVQLITMTAPGPESRPDAAAEPPSVPNPVSTGARPPDFRVHDLSRRWVEFQMANSFTNSGVALEQAASGSAGSEGSAASAEWLPPAPAIPVPAWMRGGASFDFAANRFEPGCGVLPYRPTGFLRADAESRRASYYQLMSGIACEYGIPVGLFDAMIIRESRYRTDALSPKNAFGLTQLMPGTAASLGVNRYSVEDNLRGGARYLRQQLDRFGHYHLALAAYNAGPGRVRGGLVPRIAETQAYVDNVLMNWARLSGVYRQATVLPRQTASVFPPRSVPPARVASVSLF
ncbi:hypothetical protein RLDS_03695 [Sphingobium lactosutens DS20]|uniref:Transglycosylase SLT domain-containing protein n=1 Tax=Sphingobium lactosutens DS20 TaxID=1331060 RepID=T0I0D7_9SPHN|nr:hypothetical protein M527_17620 [Sphingobium indicum IP26]EQB17763.1 hypothetical protein RLDS_03695 [Sphingobium lactosutens DS20]